ncbi:helix-turn-helix domain-containing protein [Undibacterium squillarum]|uniref:helix-turn-helix domain-containing protein n=1 Tax=Undibacterium squillarum TaxID=1131567 RepID=UPI0035B24A83
MKDFSHPEKNPPLSGMNFRQLRLQRGETQTQFWQRFGVSQSCGSRIEKAGSAPLSVAMLVSLYVSGSVPEHLLQQVMDICSKRGGNPHIMC